MASPNDTIDPTGKTMPGTHTLPAPAATTNPSPPIAPAPAHRTTARGALLAGA